MTAINIKYYLLYLLSEISSKGVPLLLLPFLTRTLDAKQLGQVAEFTAVFNLVFMLGAWASSGFIRKKIFDKGVEQPLDFYFPAIINSIFWVCFFTLLVVVSSQLFGVLSWFNTIDFIVLPLSAIFLVILKIRFSIFNSFLDVTSYFKWNFLYGVFNILLSIAFVLYSFIEVSNNRVYGMMLAPIMCLILLSLFHRKQSFSFRWSMDKCRECYSFGASLLIHQITSWARVNFDKVVLASVITLEELGEYSINSQLAMVLFVVFTALNQGLAPKMLSKLINSAENFRRFKKKIYLSFFIVFFVILSIILSVSEFLVGSGYTVDYLMLSILAFSYFINGVYLINTHSIIQSGHGNILSKISLFSSVLSVGLVVGLISYFAVWAVVVASLISSIAAFLLTYKYSKQIEQEHFNVN